MSSGCIFERIKLSVGGLIIVEADHSPRLIYHRSFAAVTVNAEQSDAIDVVTFLEACEGLNSVFDSLGSAFSVIKSDIAGNVAKIRTKYQEDTTKFGTLQVIVEAELKEKKRTAAEGLLWLKRTLEFTAQGLRHNKSNPTEELKASFNLAYTNTLAPFHSFLVRPVFQMAMSACPYRKDFYAKLGSDTECFEAMFEEWLKGLEKVSTVLVTFYVAKGIEKSVY